MGALVTIQSKIKLIAVNNVMAYKCDQTDCEVKQGDNLFDLITTVYPKGLPLNTFIYHNNWASQCDVTPQNDNDVKNLAELEGVIYVVTYPADPLTMFVAAIVVGGLMVAATLAMMPKIPDAIGQSQPPSPNNALSNRTNRQRIGGRIPDIYGEIWSVPDLLAPTYSVYVDHREIEYSYMCIGRGKYDVYKALDDTTPINLVYGSGILVYDPDTNLNDEPASVFGEQFSPNEAEFARYAAKRYTAVNGQVLAPPNSYLKNTSLTFKNPNTIETSDNISFTDQFSAGGTILIEGASELESANGITTGIEPETKTVTYNLSGQYVIESVTGNQIVLVNPVSIKQDWQTLADNSDFTVATDEVVLSTELNPLWRGHYYTNLKDHDGAYVNIKAQALYRTGKNGDWVGLRLYCEIESEIVDSNNNPIAGTLHTQQFTIQSPNADKYGWAPEGGGYDETARFVKDNSIRGSVGITVQIDNPNFEKGKRLRFRITRKSNSAAGSVGQAVDEIKLTDFYGYHHMTDDDMTLGCTTVYTKTIGTEGATAIKERKLKTYGLRLVRDWRNNDALIASNRIDDIIYDIATDPVTGKTQPSGLNMAQISAEVDRQIAYFGTDLCAQFCGTFDDTNITPEEMLDTVSQAGFFTAYTINNQIHLHFEQPQLPVATFNSHNILPDSWDWEESFGSNKGYDGIEVTYTDPDDNDNQAILRYPENGSALNPQKINLKGVRNKVQAHMHMMRRHHKNQYAPVHCQFTGADETGIVIPTHRINAANQLRADTQQGAVESIEVINGSTVLNLSSPVDFGNKTSATIFVQTIAATVDNIKCTPSDNAYQVVLNRAPTAELSTAWDAVVRATYQFVTHDNLDRDSYLVTEKSAGNNPMSHQLTCTNYTDKYYQNDKDFIKNLIT